MAWRSRKCFLLLLWLSCCATMPAFADLALGAKYSLSPRPNYERGATGVRAESALTDGRYARGTFWTSQNSVGWTRARLIRIDVDLAMAYSLGELCVGTAKGAHAGVRLPRRIDIFSSNDRQSYAYVTAITPSRNDRRGAYEVVRLCQSLQFASGRYLALFVEPDGGFFFTDEVAVSGAVARSDARRIAPAQFKAADLETMRRKIVAAAVECARSEQFETALRRSLTPALREIANTELPPLDCNSELDDASIGDRLLRRRARALDLRQRFIARDRGERLLADASDPWAPFVSSAMPVPVAAPAMARASCFSDGHAVFAIAVTNSRPRGMQVQPGLRFAESRLRAEWFEVREVATDDGQLVADALMPLPAGGIAIAAGESRQFWIDVSATDVPAGIYDLSALFETESGSSMSVELPLRLNVMAFEPSPAEFPAATVWAYSNDRLTRDVWKSALTDLHEHHINVAVLHPADLPWPLTGRSDAKARAHLQQRIAEAGASRYFLLYLGLNLDDWRDRSNPSRRFLSDAWLHSYSDWLRERVEDFSRAGIDPSRVLIYPVDEPDDEISLMALAAVANATRKLDAGPGVYSTIDRPGLAPFSSALPGLDVVQLRADRTTRKDVADWRMQGKEVWLYEPEGGGKAADPLGFYRLAAWRAFHRGASGVGFWSYADIGPTGNEWNDRDGERPDFAVAYRAGDVLGSSKRWEAWRLGLEDYALLRSVSANASNAIAVNELTRSLLAREPTSAAFEEARESLLSLLAPQGAASSKSREK